MRWKKKRELIAWRQLNENLYTFKKKKTTTTTRSLCMLRRQGIGFEISKCTTSLQAHAEQKQKKKGGTGRGDDEHVMKCCRREKLD